VLWRHDTALRQLRLFSHFFHGRGCAIRADRIGVGLSALVIVGGLVFLGLDRTGEAQKKQANEYAAAVADRAKREGSAGQQILLVKRIRLASGSRRRIPW
jgi:hypothetical protein